MSQVSICNRALTGVGGNLITSFQDGTREANLCLLHYAPGRDAVQSAYDWSFNRERTSLVKDATPPVYGYDNRYALPPNLTVHQVTNDPRGEVDVERWTVEGRYVLADAGDSVFVRYGISVTDDSLFTELYTQALVAYLAATFAIPLAESPALQQQHYGIYRGKVDEAAAVDGLQGRSERTFGGRAERARWGAGNLFGRYGRAY